MSLLADGKVAEASVTLFHLIALVQGAGLDGSPARVETGEMAADGFFPALRQYVLQFAACRGIQVSLSLPESVRQDSLSPLARVQLLRIVRQALESACYDSGAGSIQIVFVQLPMHIQVLIADDGEVVDPAETGAEDSRLARLQSLSEYAEAAGGQLEVRSGRGQGTHIILSLPMPSDTPARPLAGMRTLLVDDHPLVREAILHLLMEHGMAVVGVAQDGQDGIEQARRLRPELVLMDVHMPRLSGVAATQQIKAEMPDTRVVMLSVSAEDSDLLEATRAGASGYLLKSLKVDEFWTQLRRLAQGEAPMAPGLTARLLAGMAKQDRRTDPAALAPDLSLRQTQILQMVAQGMTYKEIGAKLHVSVHTVKYHMEQTISRLNMNSRAEVLAYARRIGLIKAEK
jgi:DNA-binding NarL/FixJ family response regulator